MDLVLIKGIRHVMCKDWSFDSKQLCFQPTKYHIPMYILVLYLSILIAPRKHEPKSYDLADFCRIG
jgi:hypothetical protein